MTQDTEFEGEDDMEIIGEWMIGIYTENLILGASSIQQTSENTEITLKN